MGSCVLPKYSCWTNKKKFEQELSIIIAQMEQAPDPAPQFEVDVDLGFALFFLFLLCFFLLVTVVRCAQTVVDPYGSISTSTYQEEQITWGRKYWGLAVSRLFNGFSQVYEQDFSTIPPRMHRLDMTVVEKGLSEQKAMVTALTEVVKCQTASCVGLLNQFLSMDYQYLKPCGPRTSTELNQHLFFSISAPVYFPGKSNTKKKIICQKQGQHQNIVHVHVEYQKIQFERVLMSACSLLLP